MPSQDALSHYVYVPKTAEKKIDAVVKYLSWLSIEENAMNVAYGIVGLGSDMVDGVPVRKTSEEMTKLGLNPSPGDSNFLIANFDFEKDRLVENFMSGNPGVPQEVVEEKMKVQYSNYYDKCLIPSALETDQYVPLLQSLIVEFVFKDVYKRQLLGDHLYSGIPGDSGAAAIHKKVRHLCAAGAGKGVGTVSGAFRNVAYAD